MGEEFGKALEQDGTALENERKRFNQGIQELANLLEARRQEADGEDKIDAEKLAGLSLKIESFIAQLNGDKVETATVGSGEPKQGLDVSRDPFAKREPSPFDNNTVASQGGEPPVVPEQTNVSEQGSEKPKSPFDL